MHWAREMDLEYLNHSSELRQYMSAGTTLSLVPCHHWLVPSTSSGFGELAGGTLMLLRVDGPEPGSFAYYSDVVELYDGGAPRIWHILII